MAYFENLCYIYKRHGIGLFPEFMLHLQIMKKDIIHYNYCSDIFFETLHSDVLYWDASEIQISK